MASKRQIFEFISAAVAGSFHKADILRTLMASREPGIKIITLAKEAGCATNSQSHPELQIVNTTTTHSAPRLTGIDSNQRDVWQTLDRARRVQ
jgi:hypothetical protein